MNSRCVEIVSASRLHFGLFSFGKSDRQFGGVGAMISAPAIRVRIRASDRFSVEGHHAPRCRDFVRRWSAFHKRHAEPACHVELIEAPRSHMGLGTGTQLGLSIAAGLSAYFDLPIASPAELAISIGRGRRSAVGTHGFGEGGLIVDGGKTKSDLVSPLHCRLDFPELWRFVMICPQTGEGLSGDDEQRAFRSLPNVDRETTELLQKEVREVMVPELVRGDFEKFSRSLFRYGETAGNCFAPHQGGPYNGPRLTAIVRQIRSIGIEGVGQSSWGPTLFALAPNPSEAESLADRLKEIYSTDEHDIWISPPSNYGAEISKKS